MEAFNYLLQTNKTRIKKGIDYLSKKATNVINSKLLPEEGHTGIKAFYNSIKAYSEMQRWEDERFVKKSEGLYIEATELSKTLPAYRTTRLIMAIDHAELKIFLMGLPKEVCKITEEAYNSDNDGLVAFDQLHISDRNYWIQQIGKDSF
eukprot:TRINITY_DN2917_c0_g2_i4.p1 TRINITY_DN2917_c0_g2~~TRINITY_DN2917_c0_g2_i4.p1  ORF type:complete len:149 (-),score=10.50 TRINITY_DN2917_c0_g2_i4:112-558(-)